MNLCPIDLLAFSLLPTPVLAQIFHFDNDVVGAVPAGRRTTCRFMTRGPPRHADQGRRVSPSAHPTQDEHGIRAAKRKRVGQHGVHGDVAACGVGNVVEIAGRVGHLEVHGR